MRKTAARVSALAIALTAVANASGATIPVSYLVQEKAFKELAPSGTMITLGLYEDSACSGSAAATATVDVDAIAIKERLKTLKPKGSPSKPLKLVELHHVFTGVNATAGTDLFVKVTATVVGAIDTTGIGECQSQEPGPGGSAPSGLSIATGSTIVDCPAAPCSGAALALCPLSTVRVGLVDCVASGNTNPVSFTGVVIPPENAAALGCNYEMDGVEGGVFLTVRILCWEVPIP